MNQSISPSSCNDDDVLPVSSPVLSLRCISTRAIHNGLLYCCIPRSCISNLSQAHCLALVNSNVLLGIPPKIVYSLERLSPALIELTYHVWEHIWENMYVNNQISCSIIEEQVAQRNEEVTYRDLYLKYLALDHAKKTKLRDTLSAKAAQVKPKHQIQQVKPGLLNTTIKRGSWGSNAVNLGLIDSIRCKVRRTTTNYKQLNHKKNPVIQISKNNHKIPVIRPKLHLRPPPDKLGLRRHDAPTLIRDPSDALADHVRQVLATRKQASNHNRLLDNLGIKL